MRRALAIVILFTSVLASASAPSARAQELAFETYTGLGWTINWDPKVVQLDSVSDLKYMNNRAGCNLALDYPRFSLCARNFDEATYEFEAPSAYDLRIPADNVQQMRDTFYPDAEPVADDLTSRPAFESDEIAWQLFADAAGGSDGDGFPGADAIYIEARQLSPDERVTLLVTGLSVREFEAAEDEIDAMLASIQTRQPTYTDPTWGWSVAWDHDHLRPSAIPDPDPETIIYLTEYDAAYQEDGTDIDIWMAHFATPGGQDAMLFDAEDLIDDFSEEFATILEDIVFEIPEGYESLEASSAGHANTFFRMPSPAPAFGVPDYWGLMDIRVLVPGRAFLMTLLLWDDTHSEQLLPLFTEFLGSISVPPLPRSAN
jgi:hypothetical protein